MGHLGILQPSSGNDPVHREQLLYGPYRLKKFRLRKYRRYTSRNW